MEPFLLHPADLTLQDAPLIGAAAVHDELRRWQGSAPERGSSGDEPEATTPGTPHHRSRHAERGTGPEQVFGDPTATMTLDASPSSGGSDTRLCRARRLDDGRNRSGFGSRRRCPERRAVRQGRLGGRLLHP